MLSLDSLVYTCQEGIYAHEVLFLFRAICSWYEKEGKLKHLTDKSKGKKKDRSIVIRKERSNVVGYKIVQI